VEGEADWYSSFVATGSTGQLAEFTSPADTNIEIGYNLEGYINSLEFGTKTLQMPPFTPQGNFPFSLNTIPNNSFLSILNV
jgi:hypothetical protein